MVRPVPAFELPRIIQGGMGIGVSGWRLARAVAREGQLGVVSGTAVDSLFVRRLQDGDPGGHLRRAIAHFPIPSVAHHALSRWFKPRGRDNEPYALLPMFRQHVSPERERLAMLAAFAEVFLARQGHDGPIGINLLVKIQMPNLPSLYGAMLAGVDVVLMGAGIPREIPGALDALAEHRPATLRFEIDGPDAGEPEFLTLDPADHGAPATPLRRPHFLAIVSSHTLALTLARKANGRVDGFVVEGPTAGGHNAPPRGALALSPSGEPVYGERDLVDLDRLRDLELPFWLAGGMGVAGAVPTAIARGARGVQVGTLFALCEESGIEPGLRTQVLTAVREGRGAVFTDPVASPTGYPFKLLRLEGIPQQDDTRERVCDLGYLRVPVRRADGGIEYRCASEPVDVYAAKGGAPEATVGRRCLCNGLLANLGVGQLRAGGVAERPLLTSGDDLESVRAILQGRSRYHAADVIRFLLGPSPALQA
jgi:nitronate monooxygenase